MPLRVVEVLTASRVSLLYLPLILLLAGCSTTFDHVGSHVTPHLQNLSWYGNMEVRKGDAIPTVHFASPSVVAAFEDRNFGDRVGGKVLNGSIQGVKTGFKYSVGACEPIIRSFSQASVIGPLIGVLLCGGMVVGGTAAGAVVGTLSSAFIDDAPEDLLRELFVGENVYQVIREGLISVDPEGTSDRLCKDGRRRDGRWSFEKEGETIEGYLKINVVEIGLLQLPQAQDSNYKLLLKLEPVLTDLNDHTLASQEIEIAHKSYPYEEWAEYDAKLLKQALAESYVMAIQLVIRNLVMGCEEGDDENGLS